MQKINKFLLIRMYEKDLENTRIKWIDVAFGYFFKSLKFNLVINKNSVQSIILQSFIFI